MNQNFSSEQLLLLSNDYEISNSPYDWDGLIETLDSNYISIINDSFSFDIKRVGKYYHTDDLTHKLVLRKLNSNLKKLYKDKQSNRRMIISQLISLLQDDCPMWILKTDIESFYESIDRKRIVSKLKDDAIVSHHSISLLDELFDFFETQGLSGLPRGIGLSATLSEIYMRQFDRWILSQPKIFFYARFVDDIIIFCSEKKDAFFFNDEISSRLEKGLRKKKSKTKIINGNMLERKNILQFLGYKFSTEKKAKKSKKLFVSIADKKVKKIKTKIVQAILDNWKSRNFALLERRIKFLTGNYSVKISTNSNDLKAGIYYNYSQINDLRVLDELNLFFRRLLGAKHGTIAKKIEFSLSEAEKDRLLRYSFKAGFKNRMFNNFFPEELVELTSCWK